MGLLARLFGGRVNAEIENYRNNVSAILCMYLFEKKYSKQYEFDKAIPLAAAVTNELFNVPPGNEEGRVFLSSNKQLIETALQDIKNELKVCYMVSLYAHMHGNVAGKRGTFSPKMLQYLVRLRNLEILLPGEEMQFPSSAEGLMQQAREFEIWVAKNSK